MTTRQTSRGSEGGVPEQGAAIVQLRQLQSAKLATAREAARSLVAVLADDDPDEALVEGEVLDIMAAMAARDGLADAIDVLEEDG